MSKLVNTVEDDLRVGDVVLLQAGDLVPADLRLVEATGLEVDEFELTGEIMPVVKQVNGRDVAVYKGSRVIRGTGKGYVTATGEQRKISRLQFSCCTSVSPFFSYCGGSKIFYLIVDQSGIIPILLNKCAI
jgi:Ca2+-transporting ATPase